MGQTASTVIDRPVKLGKISKDTAGNPVLINPQGRAYAINRLITEVWDMLDGAKTPEQVIEEFIQKASIASQDVDRSSTEIYEIIRKLKSVNLAN